MLVDLHAKSSASKGVSVTAQQLIEKGAKEGLNAFAFTENRQTRHALELVELGQSLNLPVFVGIEVVTDAGILLGFPPQIDDFLLEESWREIDVLKRPSAEYVVEMFQEIGGAVIASKPYDLERRYAMGDRLFKISGLDAIEVFNPHVGQIQADFAQEAAQSLRLPTTGGSDPTDSLKDVGAFATFFEKDFSTQSEFVEALKGERYWSIKIGAAKQAKTTRPDLPKAPSKSSDDSRDHSRRRRRRGSR